MRLAHSGAAALTMLAALVPAGTAQADTAAVDGRPAAHHRAVAAAGAHQPTTTRQASVATARFARETVRTGDRDASPSQIEHVRELQYRLTWAGVYDGPVTGFFGDLTEAAVRRYQRRVHVPTTGVAGRATWRHLIPDTIRGRRDLPAACTGGGGWDACYDRARHEVTLWHAGRLLNAWLVRGGDSDTPTRTGHFRVYYRDIDHVSGLYDSPMPYSQFFSGGEAFHGSATMVDPFTGHSHGCINMYVEDARQLWNLTSRRRLAVHVHGTWS